MIRRRSSGKKRIGLQAIQNQLAHTMGQVNFDSRYLEHDWKRTRGNEYLRRNLMASFFPDWYVMNSGTYLKMSWNGLLMDNANDYRLEFEWPVTFVLFYFVLYKHLLTCLLTFNLWHLFYFILYIHLLTFF